MKNKLPLFAIVILILAGVCTAQAQQPSSAERRLQHWIAGELRSGNHKLSPSEREGAYRCSVERQRVGQVYFELGFVTIVFDQTAPVFFRQSEISPELLPTLRSIKPRAIYSILCVHSAFRDDWQMRYDADHEVNHKLLGIIEHEKPGIIKSPREKWEDRIL